MRMARHTAQRPTIGQSRKYHNPATRILIRDNGRRNFQVKAKSWSMRNRGRVPRNQIMTKKRTQPLAKRISHDGRKAGPLQPPKNMMEQRIQIQKALKNSPM